MIHGKIDSHPHGMIFLCQEVTTMNAKVTVSLHPSLLALLDRFARKWGTTRSGALAELLRQVEQEEIEREMEEGYVALSETSKGEVEAFMPAQEEVVNSDHHEH
jgi:metal-responsive CopG/Arc/MetJ family transcriptional regulator